MASSSSAPARRGLPRCVSRRAGSPARRAGAGAIQDSNSGAVSTARGGEGSLLELLSESYDCFLLDQFGVLHDGKNPFPHALDLCQRLAEDRDKRLVVLSNSSRRNANTFERLENMGFKREWFAGCVTSGDVAHYVLNARKDGGGDSLRTEEEAVAVVITRDGVYANLWRDVRLPRGPATRIVIGRPAAFDEDTLRCLHFTWASRGANDGFASTQPIDLQGMPRIRVVNSPDEADFILIHGTEGLSQVSFGGEVTVVPMAEAEVDRVLSIAAEIDQGRGLPMLVANPDLVTVSGYSLVKMPGSLARTYGELGVSSDRIHLLGKPCEIIYDIAGALFLPEGTQKERVVAVGDSLAHDIRGAMDFGIDSVFVTSGIHASDLHPAGGGEDLDGAAMEGLARKHTNGVMPTIIAKHFQ